MKLYTETDQFKLYQGNMLDMLQIIKPNSIDSIVTDPPYELNFMNKGWDNSGVAFQKTTWEKCYQVLKPGGYLLAFGGSRTFHRIACAIEDAGFEIRDTIMWLYGSGFPKSLNIGLAIDKKNGVESEIIGYQGSMMDFRDTGKKQKEISGIDKLSFGQVENSERKQNPIYKANNQWSGWGTALKPAYEPIIVARKPCENSCIDNVLKYGVGGINIDECRIGNGDFNTAEETTHTGRFPSNVILTYDETDENEVCENLPIENEESAARYFYCAKASKRDRDEGLDNFVSVKTGSMQANVGGVMQVGYASLKGEPKEIQAKKNIHPTVKPTDLMQYLIRLATPKGGIVLDPFNGSGSTGKAVMYENKDRQANYRYIGVELTKEYLPIAEARIKYASNNNAPIEISEIPLAGQMSFEDLLGDSV